MRVPLKATEVEAFRKRVWSAYEAHGRFDLPWRHTTDPYSVLVSEVMLQQTQVARVLAKYPAWLDEFPTFDALAAAPLEAVLRVWQGLGYNRRALSLKRAAEVISSEQGGVLHPEFDLRALPGIGEATAAGVAVFAFNQPAVYLETNVRAVYLHEFFVDREDVRDSELRPLIETTLVRETPREWFYALLDYGYWLKRALPNPSRRSAHHTKQSKFEGSRRQRRSRLLRAVMAAPGSSSEELSIDLGIASSETVELLEALAAEGFLACEGGGWRIA